MTACVSRKRIGALGLALMFTATVQPASAYCRVTTCRPDLESCPVDAGGCVSAGVPLAWTGRKVRFVVDWRGSELRGISGNELLEAATLAAASWNDVTCYAEAGPFDAVELELGQAEAGFDANGPNDNVIRFLDASWPHAAEALGKTTLGMNLDTGEILDADIVLNSEAFEFSLEPRAQVTDLVAVLTHEMGHALGLDHSPVPHATMRPETQGYATSDLLDIEQDDEAGLCAAYAEVIRNSEEVPVTETMACSAEPGMRGGVREHGALFAALALSFMARRRRRA